MLDTGAYAEFHFLRPLWLLTLLPALLLWLIVARRTSVERQWRKVVAPHLLNHLKVGAGNSRRFRPLHLTVLVLVLGAVGLAGPTWEREVSPYSEDTAPLVLALDVSISMNAVDVQPTRLERAKQKVRDLLELRAGARSALIAYAGTAHTVLPLCDDPAVFETFLAALGNDVMPVDGKEPARALALAERLLADHPTPGSIVFLTDGIAEEHVDTFAEHAGRSDDEVVVLAVGTREGGPVRKGEHGFETDSSGRRVMAKLDVEGLRALESRAGAFVAGATVDDADVKRIQSEVQSHLREVRQRDETVRWKDRGYWLTLPVAFLGLLWFRRGWTIRWSSTALLLALVTGCSSTGRQEIRFADLWWTADQQGSRHFDRGEFADAAEVFEDPMWKGIAAYRNGDYQQAADAFARSTTPEASFNLGNAYVMNRRNEEALAAYEAALADRPDWPEAIENRDAVKALLLLQLDLPEQDQASGEPSFDPDDFEFDEKGKRGKPGQVEASQWNDDLMAEMWLRRLQNSPSDYLRQRFAMEAAGKVSEAAP